MFCEQHSTKQELPNDVLKASKYISDLTKQTSKVGELRGAIQAGVMTEQDVYAELGELVNGKPGRVGDELIVVDLTGTGAQDAAIGQVRTKWWTFREKKMRDMGSVFVCTRLNGIRHLTKRCFSLLDLIHTRRYHSRSLLGLLEGGMGQTQ